jgi:nucleoside-diphosphate-sugar epimerase
MKTVIIGAGGFLGQRLSKLVAEGSRAGDELVLIDTVPTTTPSGSARVASIQASFTDPQALAALEGATEVYLLASILGGAAEANHALARRVNVDASLDLIELLRDRVPVARLVFASTIAVFGKPMPDLVTDQTPTAPIMIYGAQKLMLEVAISNFVARGWLDGVSLRLSGVMARDGTDARLRTAFMSRVFYAIMRGEDIALPVHPSSRTWFTSVDMAARNFLHAGRLAAGALGRDRALTLPALHLSFEELVQALFRRFPDSRSKVTYAPDDELVSLFGSYPPLETAIADRLGFRRDKDADTLVAGSL